MKNVTEAISELIEKYVLPEEVVNVLKEYQKVLKPKKLTGAMGEVYWAIDYEGDFANTKNSNSTFDKWNWESGNYYTTEEECQLAKDKIILNTKMQRFADENNYGIIDWENEEQPKYYIVYRSDVKNADLLLSTISKAKDIYFTQNCKDKAFELFKDEYARLYGVNNENK